MLAAKLDDLSLIPGALMLDVEDWVQQAVLWAPVRVMACILPSPPPRFREPSLFFDSRAPGKHSAPQWL